MLVSLERHKVAQTVILIIQQVPSGNPTSPNTPSCPYLRYLSPQTTVMGLHLFTDCSQITAIQLSHNHVCI